MPKEPRYFVDERVGCIAVRDQKHTDPEYPGLHEDTEGVVWYRHGIGLTRNCPECGHVLFQGWEVKPEHVREAHQECERLNNMESPDAFQEGA